MIGLRDKGIYGEETSEMINSQIKTEGEKIGFVCEVFQTNHEGDLIDKIQSARDACDGGIINAGVLAHYSYCLREAISAIRIPFVEVHMSNIYTREEFRRRSVISDVCIGQITGFGKYSYFLALRALKELT